MKTPQKIALIVLSILFLISITSCSVQMKHDNGKHKGWYKNSNNPHFQTMGKGTVKSNGNGNSKLKSKS